MGQRSLYDDDIYAWARQQAESLRRLAETRRDLPNDLDLENVAEEIEDVGSAQRSAAESFIRLIFVHLIKLAAAPEAVSRKHWRKEITTFHNELMSKLTPSMWTRIDLDLLWSRALREARADLDAEEIAEVDAIVWSTLQTCPLDFPTLAREDFEIGPTLAGLANLS